ncbi:MAG TPA: VWA domain-containing protein [Terracidiphilus sp.]|jgi:VWFA-related protein
MNPVVKSMHSHLARFRLHLHRGAARSVSLFLVLLVMLFGALAAKSQGPGSQTSGAQLMQDSKRNDAGSYTLRVNAEEVVLNCTVLDAKGELVNDLNKNEFKVSEDKIPQTIVSLQHQDLPVSIGLLIDNSGSMRAKRDAIVSAALDLVKASNPGDETFVVNFSDQAYLNQDFTSELDKLRSGLTQLSLSGGTAIYDTVVKSADKLEKTATRPRRALIVVTDGEDNASKMSLEDAIRRVQRMQGPVIYSIGLLFDGESSGRETRHARQALELLAGGTGGISFFPSSLKEVDAVAAEVARDIRNQYTIAYRSTHASNAGSYHSVRVEAQAPGHNKLRVLTRTGYVSTALR